MNLKAGKKAPQIVFRGGEPSAVILDIEVYQEMLQRLEDIEDLNPFGVNSPKLASAFGKMLA
ncbi:MAG: hypothetical protein Q7U03_14745 [Syntrophales bacterium]|nr:hypothetical protein [Syntrophales bacterium]